MPYALGFRLCLYKRPPGPVLVSNGGRRWEDVGDALDAMTAARMPPLLCHCVVMVPEMYVVDSENPKVIPIGSAACWVKPEVAAARIGPHGDPDPEAAPEPPDGA
jgi:hypothetical protein